MSAPSLGSYGARVVRIHTGAGVEETKGKGGGLEAAVDSYGTAPLAALLGANPDWLAVELEDADVVLRVERNGVAATLTVQWSGGESYSEPLVLPGPGAQGFVPDVASRGDVVSLLNDVASSVYVVEGADGLEFYGKGEMGAGPSARPLVASIGPSGPLGPAWFRERLGTKANYIAGAMAGGIGSPELVIAMGKAGYIGFLGAGGLPMPAVKEAVPRIREALGENHAHGFNLLHNPVEPHVEEATVDLYLEHGCRVVSASAYMGLTAAVVRFRFTGATRDAEGTPHCPNTVLAKVSRPEVAEHFLRPPPAKLLDSMVESGGLTAEEAGIARELPVAEGITCEADSGGHTDHRPLPVILPVMRAQRDRIAAELGYGERGIRVAIGAGGGMGAPEALYAAFAMGADYVLTGSVNQCTPEAGTSELAKTMLLSAGMADVGSGAAPDMFEIGAHVQVLSRGTMYAQRSIRLYQVYKAFSDWQSVPEADRKKIEKQILARPFDEVWEECAAYWGERDPAQVERALSDGRHQMALVFRWYLGMSSRWARMGEKSRKKDFQIWCGPSMGAFNDWVAGTSLEPLAARNVVAVADALLRGATICERAAQLRASGVELPESAGHWRPS